MAEKNNKKEEPSFFAIIPAYVLYDKSLNPNAKLLFASLTGLAKKEGYAYASNTYLASLYGVDKSSITHWIKDLADKGYITQEFIYDEGKPYIKERRIYIAKYIPFPEKKRSSKPNPEKKPIPMGAEEEGGGDVAHHGGEDNHQGGGDVAHHGGEISPEILVKAINIKAAAADQKEDFQEKPPPENGAAAESFINHEFECLETFNRALKSLKDENQVVFGEESAESRENDVLELKQHLKKLNPGLIFDKSFYYKIVDYVKVNELDNTFVSWMYEKCVRKKPVNISGYFFKIFFEARYLELFRESSKPPPPAEKKFILCPVCGFEHESNDQSCPHCGLDITFLEDKDKIESEKLFFGLPPDAKAAYEEEYGSIVKNHFNDHSYEKTNRDFKELKIKYGLLQK